MSSGSMCIPDGGTWTLKTRNLSRFEITSSQFHPTPGRYVELQETDTGVGMTAETMDRFFDRSRSDAACSDDRGPTEIVRFDELFDVHFSSSLQNPSSCCSRAAFSKAPVNDR